MLLNYEVFPLWQMETSTIPIPAWSRRIMLLNYFGWFFPQPWLVFSHVCDNQYPAKYLKEGSVDLQGPRAESCLLLVLGSLLCAQPKLSSYSERTELTLLVFHSSGITVLYYVCPMSQVPFFLLFFYFSSCFRQKEESGPHYSILTGNRSSS